jgi:hypothetical protein
MRHAIIKKVQKMIKIELKGSDSESSESEDELLKDPYDIGALDSLLTEVEGDNS